MDQVLSHSVFNVSPRFPPIIWCCTWCSPSSRSHSIEKPPHFIDDQNPISSSATTYLVQNCSSIILTHNIYEYICILTVGLRVEIRDGRVKSEKKTKYIPQKVGRRTTCSNQEVDRDGTVLRGATKCILPVRRFELLYTLFVSLAYTYHLLLLVQVFLSGKHVKLTVNALLSN